MIFVGRRGNEDSWRSFETDPTLRITKKRIYERCVPCLSDLLKALKRSPHEVSLEIPMECWKLSVILPSYDDCMRLLELFSELFPNEYVYGKFGTGDKKKPTKVVVFHLDQNVERLKDIEPKVLSICSSLTVPFEIKTSRGCSHPYEVLFGPHEMWKKKMAVINWKRLEEVIQSLEKMLYGFEKVSEMANLGRTWNTPFSGEEGI
ncbi:MAG: hypothetical protein NZ583_02950 [Desulfobacterota bacterium]|nr:hypothetical protein [Thermodesulfobacteriota bacterium]